MGRLCRDYGWSLEYVRDELPCIQGWALVAWGIENDTGLVVERTGAGYIGQELQRRERVKNGTDGTNGDEWRKG